MSEDGSTPQQPRAAAEPAGFGVAKAAIAFLPPVTLITGLLFYFGWARTYTQARYLGADASVFGYTTQDYLLRSVDSLYFPLIVLTGAALVCLLVHQRVAVRLSTASKQDPDEPAARVGTWVMVAGLVLLAYGLLYSVLLYRSHIRFFDLTGPLALGVGVLATAYGGWMHARARGGATAGAWGQTGTWERLVAAGLLLAIFALTLFWAVGNYATWRGQDLARSISENYRSRPGVVVYAPQQLALDAPGVQVERIEGEDQVYRYRYSGLHLLDHAGGQYFLMPADWAQQPTLVLLPDDEGLRIELTAPTA